MAKKREPTTEEALENVRKQKKDIEFWMENGGPDSRSPLDAVRLEELARQENELLRKLEDERLNPPQRESFFGRLFRR